MYTYIKVRIVMAWWTDAKQSRTLMPIHEQYIHRDFFLAA